MRLLFLCILSLPFFFSIAHHKKGEKIEKENTELPILNENREQYIFSTQEKDELITGINSWLDLIANSAPVITKELASNFDEIVKTYPKKGQSDGISAKKETKWGRIYLSVTFGKNIKEENRGGIYISENAPIMVLTNFNKNNFTKELALQFIDKNKIIDTNCSRHQKDETCINSSSSAYYKYKYRSLKYPSLIVIFGMENAIEKYNIPGMYPKNFTSIIIETKSNH